MTHELLDAVAFADRLVVLEHGCAAQDGTVEEQRAAAVALRGRPRRDQPAPWNGERPLGHVAPRSGDRHRRRHGDVYVAIHPRAVSLHRAHPEGRPRNVWPGRANGSDLPATVRLHVDGMVPLVAEVTDVAPHSSTCTTASTCGCRSRRRRPPPTRSDERTGKAVRRGTGVENEADCGSARRAVHRGSREAMVDRHDRILEQPRGGAAVRGGSRRRSSDSSPSCRRTSRSRRAPCSPARAPPGTSSSSCSTVRWRSARATTSSPRADRAPTWERSLARPPATDRHRGGHDAGAHRGDRPAGVRRADVRGPGDLPEAAPAMAKRLADLEGAGTTS